MITLEDGVYVGLEPERYFAADRLGSTDLVTLHRRPADWFYKSRHNPFYKRTVSEEMEFGSALHLLLLEGDLPVCQMRLPGEHHLLTALRKAQDELARYRAEDHDLMRVIYAMQADHAEALRREEERGYEKGLADGRAPSPKENTDGR